ncbi:MAG: DoxX family protein [Chloroflexota bacterium]
MRPFASDVRVPLFYLALVRIALGVTFLSHAAGQMLGLAGGKSWLVSSSPLAELIQRSLADPAVLSPYHNFEQSIIQPNMAVFNYLVILAEVAVGISLTLGLFTRLGAVVALWLSANYTLMKGLPSATGDIDHVFLVCELVVLLANAGLVWGVDGLLFAPASRPAARPSTTRSTPARA